MGSLNKVIIVGRLGQDPELKYTTSGQPVTNISLATDEGYVKDGQKVNKTEWHRIVVFGRQAETTCNYLSKGSMALVEGKLQTRQWEDQQGQKRYITEIVAQRVQFMDSKNSQAQGGYLDAPPIGKSQSAARQAPAAQQQQPEEDLGSPFPSEASSMDETPF